MPSPDSPQARFEALLQDHRGILHKVAGTYCRHPEDRRDLVQEICAQMWRAFPRYDPAHPFSTWAYRVALNVAITHVRATARRREREESYDAHDHDPADPTTLSSEADDRVRALYAVMERLNPFDHALLVLHLDGYRNHEIAEVLGLTLSNTSTRLSRLRHRLQAGLASPDLPSS